jgi:hypothetical protein
MSLNPVTNCPLATCSDKCCGMNSLLQLIGDEVQAKYCCNIMPGMSIADKAAVLSKILSQLSNSLPFKCNLDCTMCDNVFIGSFNQFIQYIQSPYFLDQLETLYTVPDLDEVNTTCPCSESDQCIDTKLLKCLIPYFAGGNIGANLATLLEIYTVLSTQEGMEWWFTQPIGLDRETSDERRIRLHAFADCHGINPTEIGAIGDGGGALGDRAGAPMFGGNQVNDGLEPEDYELLATWLGQFYTNYAVLTSSCGIDIDQYVPDGIVFIGVCDACEPIDICSLIPPALANTWVSDDAILLDWYIRQIFGTCDCSPYKSILPCPEPNQEVTCCDLFSLSFFPIGGFVFFKMPSSPCCPTKCIALVSEFIYRFYVVSSYTPIRYGSGDDWVTLKVTE